MFSASGGSVKTTLLRLLNGLLKPAKGDILIEGKNIKSINRDALFTKVCTMFQNPEDQLFSPHRSSRYRLWAGEYGLEPGSGQAKGRIGP